MIIRKSGSWNSVWDDRILEVMDVDDEVRVGKIADRGDIHISRSQVSRRCKKLAEHGLVDSHGNGVYIITDKGRAYLEGRYDAEAEEMIVEEQREGSVIHTTPEDAAKQTGDALQNDDDEEEIMINPDKTDTDS
jgi:predicted ArsR family transcriptional regulator